MPDKEITIDEDVTFSDGDEPEPEQASRDNWTYKDIENFYDRVRMTLNATSVVKLPDSYIDFPEKAPFAESSIKARVPLWKELDDEKFKMFESIIVYQTAALLQDFIASRTVKKKQIPTITLEYNDSNMFGVNGMSLLDMIDYLVAKLNGEDAKSGFVGFRVTEGSNRCCCKRTWL